MICNYCNEEYVPKFNPEKSKFCSRSCSSLYKNRVLYHKSKPTCKNCSNPVNFHKSKFCSRECSIIAKQKNGNLVKRVSLRKFLIRERGHMCECCKLTTWNEKPIPLTLDHMDGNASNNDHGNLRILCWNCHAQTPTFGSKNKGNGRKSRGLRQS